MPLVIDGGSGRFENDGVRPGYTLGGWLELLGDANVGEGFAPPASALDRDRDIAENSERVREASAEANVGLLDPALLDGPRDGGLDSEGEKCVKFGLEFTWACVAATAAATAAAPALVPALKSHISLRYPMTDLNARWCLSRCFCSLSIAGLAGPAVLA